MVVIKKKNCIVFCVYFFLKFKNEYVFFKGWVIDYRIGMIEYGVELFLEGEDKFNYMIMVL